MSKEICISSTPHETRLAILEDDQLAEIYYERENEYTLAGSIYKGRVTRVLPGMQSAFVEVGLERDAFLYVTDFLEEQGDAADFERVAGVAPPREPSAEPAPEENGAGDSSAEPVPAGREQGREQGQRLRGRGRNRGRGDSQQRTQGGGRSEAQASQPISIEPFDSAGFSPASHVHEATDEAVDPIRDYSSVAPEIESAGLNRPAQGSDGSEAEDSPEGTRRWRGRRGRRGGSGPRDSREQQSEAPRQQAGAGSDTVRGAVPDQIASISAGSAAAVSTTTGPRYAVPLPTSAVRPQAGAVPIVLPGESLSKYGGTAPMGASQARSTSPSGKSGARSSLTQGSGIAPPSTLVEVPLSWDGSGALPGETISRYCKSGDASGETRTQGADHSAPKAQELEESQPTGNQEVLQGAVSSEAAEPRNKAEHSMFETAYELHDEEPEAESSAATSHASNANEEASDAGSLEMTEEVAEFEPEEASASYRIDRAAPSEFRVASTVEDEVEPAAYNAVAPDVQEQKIGAQSGHEDGGPEYEPGTEGAAQGDSGEVEAGSRSGVHQDNEGSERNGSAQMDRADGDAAHSPKGHSGGFWQSVKELVTGHSAAEEQESAEGKPRTGLQQRNQPGVVEGMAAATEGNTAEGFLAVAPEQSMAVVYEEREANGAGYEHSKSASEEAPAPREPESRFMLEQDPDEAIFDVPESNRSLFGDAATRDGQAGSEDRNRKPAEDGHGNAEQGEAPKGFAPGSGVLEEETIEEEEYDFEPIHAHAEDHDLEELEEETLHRGGTDLGEAVRETHLEQRVKRATAEGLDENEAGWDESTEDSVENGFSHGSADVPVDGSGGFTEEDFSEPDNELEEEDDQEAAIARQAAAPARTGNERDGRNGDPRTRVDRPGDRAGDRGRGGRGRRPGSNGGSHGGSRRQNTQASDLPVISELLKQGQEILVQIAKEPIAKKGARITSHIALPGRFLVFMPTVNHVGVSRKISSDEERQRLKRILISEKGTAAGGFIVRTAADGAGEEDLRADIRFLLALWNEIKQRSDEAKAPALIYHDLNLIERVLRDQVSDNFSAIWVDSETEYERIVRFLQRFQPSLVRRVKLYTKETPLFEQFGIQEEISKALKSKVWLKSGGSIVINQTEALVAIDINTGKFVGKTTRLEDTILRTNLDAIPEIVRQIRLRDLGGIIVIDFIDMDERKNRNRVLQMLEDELKHDRAPSKVLPFNDFGLVAITRKRVKQSLERTLSVQCEVCTGTGMVKSPTTVCNEIYSEMRKMHKTLERKDVLLRVHPEVVKSLKSASGRWLNELEEMTGKTIIVKSDPALHPEQFDIH